MWIGKEIEPVEASLKSHLSAISWLRLIFFCAMCLTLVGQNESETKSAEAEHAALFTEQRYPSANTCATCHPDHFREWSVSPHAYAQLSPVFNAMQGTIVKLTNGTNGDFCIRCHTPVGMNMGEPVFMSNLDRHPTSREGVTCITCHRVSDAYGKLSGRLAISQGDLFEPVVGPSGNQELERVIESGEYYVNTDPNRAGRAIHKDAKPFFQLTTSGFCATCHDVNLINGFRLEEAFSEFKTSPAAKNETSCQDCHMGVAPGEAKGYAQGPAALVGGVPTQTRKRTNHMFIGPDYSVIHPALFPHNTRATEMATLREWLTFDDAAGWGSESFEAKVAPGTEFPERWKTADDRFEARDVINQNKALLAEANQARLKVLQAGYKLGEVQVKKASQAGLSFSVEVANGTTGHGVPTGFDAERLVFLRVKVYSPDDQLIFISGDLDPNGDVRDEHSLYVHGGVLPQDPYLFTLQSKFITRMERGGEREQILALNVSPDPLPFLRPSTNSTILTGRPGAVRKHKQGIAPGDARFPEYEVKKRDMRGSGTYRIQVELIAGMIPVNLISAIQGVGFDYGLSPRQIADRVVAGHLTIASREVTFDVP